MKQLLICVTAMTSWLLPSQSIAQGIDVGVTGVGLLAIQPIDEAYVGSPYLNEGIGGLATGFGAGVSAIFSTGLVVAGEYSRARFERQQYGRLVGGGYPNDGVPHTTRLHDSLLSGLVGYARTAGQTGLVVLGGVGMKLDDPTIDHESREPFDLTGETKLPFALTVGLDVLQSVHPRAALVFGARYSHIDRPENQRYLGIGSQVLRIAAGIRVRLN